MGPVASFLSELLVITFLLQGAEASPCPKKWMFFGGSCYALFENPLSWNDAEADCQTQKQGAHLASILDDHEMKTIAAYIRFNQEKNSAVWIGLFAHKASEISKWQWVDMSPLPYTAWAPGEPSGTGGVEKCAELKTNDYLQWNDRDCETALSYLCRYSRY
ncbi:Hypothetical predicted protein [Podarcis lilfordi]|uniref:C-type lectin domain-containing protein n=1 Tax=Podarcis lilfordi TaxID=74358 RepID=A0AA35KYJ7_9SAUR|nr:Hypothetical predicted protein [Podarcis lilfordi]